MSFVLPLLLLAAEIPVNPGDDFETIVQNAQPGDEVIFNAGTYETTGYWGVALAGTADQPIVIRAAEGAAVIIEGSPDQNTIDISGSYYTLAGFEIVGGSHGVRVGNSSHALFEDLHIHDTGDVGLSCNRPGETYEDVTIRRVHVHHTSGTGECFYLGCNDGACTMLDSLIEFNWCHDTQAASQGDGIELKTGSYNNMVRHNVIHDVLYPGITMYGTSGQTSNVVEGNIIWNAGDNGIQTVGDVVVRSNVIINSGNNGIQAKPSQGEVPTDAIIVHNTVIGAGDACLRGNDWPANNNNFVAANAFFCEATSAIRLINSTPGMFVDNGVLGGLEGVPGGTFDLQAPEAELVAPASWNAYPLADSALLDAASQAFTGEDFNCLPRDPESPDVGAYEWMGADNPGWIPEPGFKQCATGGDGDGDTTGDGDGDATGDGDGDGEGDATGDGDGDSAGSTGGEDEIGTDGSENAGADDDAQGSGCSCGTTRTGSSSGPALLMLLSGLVLARGRRRSS